MPRLSQRPDLGPASVPLEPTYSREEVAAHFGCTVWQVDKLIRDGRRRPYRGGLFPTFKPSHKCRRIPLSAIDRHKRFMSGERVQEDAAA